MVPAAFPIFPALALWLHNSALGVARRLCHPLPLNSAFPRILSIGCHFRCTRSAFVANVSRSDAWRAGLIQDDLSAVATDRGCGKRVCCPG